ncbi:MAG: M20/M25/M40 family metallo-hydrolase [Treponema sp.]|nr:M20/M25/M40 family metallo-hydrolase [Treponema sp.]
MGNIEAEAPLKQFQDYLEKTYPAFHRVAEQRVLSPYAVVYRWPSNAGTALEGGKNKPVLFLAHYDVVPAEQTKWTVPPFDGELRDGYVYGRGALDMKNTLISLMDAAEELCTQGFSPRREIWFAFGGDEERNGTYGAEKIAQWFASQNLRFEWILDEGGVIAEDQIKDLEKPLALVGIEEKGYLSLELSVAQAPGHASKPPRIQAAAVLARALTRLSKRSFPPRLIPTVERFFIGLAPFAPKKWAWVIRYPRLFFPMLAVLADNMGSDFSAMLRTTVAMTQLEGSAADNVMPSLVRAVINLRLLYPWKVETAVGFIKKTINDDRVVVKIHQLATDPVPATEAQARRVGPGWEALEEAIEEIFPGTAILPYLMTATTDSRHYQTLSEGIFRFAPVCLKKEELARIHGHDERISTKNLESGVQFYIRLFKNA